MSRSGRRPRRVTCGLPQRETRSGYAVNERRRGPSIRSSRSRNRSGALEVGTGDAEVQLAVLAYPLPEWFGEVVAPARTRDIERNAVAVLCVRTRLADAECIVDVCLAAGAVTNAIALGRLHRRPLPRALKSEHEPAAWRNLRPRVATRSKWARIEALLRNRAFVEDYTHARARWRDGASIAFPPGTYWLRRFAYVPVAQA